MFDKICMKNPLFFLLILCLDSLLLFLVSKLLISLFLLLSLLFLLSNLLFLCVWRKKCFFLFHSNNKLSWQSHTQDFFWNSLRAPKQKTGHASLNVFWTLIYQLCLSAHIQSKQMDPSFCWLESRMTDLCIGNRVALHTMYNLYRFNTIVTF